MKNSIVEKINKAHSIVLSTHRQSDGDGLGAQVGLFHALIKLGKKARILNVDLAPKKYSFLKPELYMSTFEEAHAPLEPTDLCLIFDTNDRRLLEPLYSELEDKCKEILFIDHHPLLKDGPQPTSGSVIDVNAASTGEIAYHLITQLHVALDANIARALYTSIVFDTQNFRYIRGRPDSHKIAAHLLEFESNPEEVHRYLFGNHTVGKLRFLAHALNDIKFLLDDQLAILLVSMSEMSQYALDFDDARDIVDMIMNIDSLEAAVLIREDGPNQYKISIRSKGQIEVLPLAESLGGGGHKFASGAYSTTSYDELYKSIVDQLSRAIKELRPSKR